MAQTTIEWTATIGPDGTRYPGFTFNPWVGCVEMQTPEGQISPACLECYARTLATGRMGLKVWGQGAPRQVTSTTYWRQPYAWNKKAQQLGVRLKVFCASLADVFEEHDGPLTGDTRCWGDLDDVREALWRVIEETPHLNWLLLTKRPDNVLRMVESARGWLGGHGWPRHVWVGTTAENQARAAERLPHLLKVPAPVRFVSYEPAAGAVDWRPWLYSRCEVHDFPGGMCTLSCPLRRRGIEWLIAGGQSGLRAKPSHPLWFTQARDQCAAAGVPFFFKQWGEWLPISDAGPEHAKAPEGSIWFAHEGNPDDLPVLTYRVGKKRAGRLLDGVEHSAWPKAAR